MEKRAAYTDLAVQLSRAQENITAATEALRLANIVAPDAKTPLDLDHLERLHSEAQSLGVGINMTKVKET
jgi:hypothetical protein